MKRKSVKQLQKAGFQACPECTDGVIIFYVTGMPNKHLPDNIGICTHCEFECVGIKPVVEYPKVEMPKIKEVQL